jgi:hypothetical protein
MAISIFPIPSSSSVSGKAFSVPQANVKYELASTFASGIYTISCASSTVATVTFSGSNFVTNAVTNSGSISVNLASDVTKAYVSIDTGTDIVVNINQTAVSLSGTNLSGTLDTITSSGTYNTTGKLFVLAVGAGGGGGAGGDGSSGWGGGYGNLAHSLIYTNTATSVTIGSAGNGGAGGLNNNGTHPTPGNAGGATSFGNYVTANGGVAGVPNTDSRYGTYANPGGGAGSGGNWQQNGGAGGVAVNPAITVKSGTNGGGGGGGNARNNNANGGAGGGSGIGTGGNGGNSAASSLTPPNAATGYGAGGGGGAGWDYGYTDGAAGSPGVVYVLRGF